MLTVEPNIINYEYVYGVRILDAVVLTLPELIGHRKIHWQSALGKFILWTAHLVLPFFSLSLALEILPFSIDNGRREDERTWYLLIYNACVWGREKEEEEEKKLPPHRLNTMNLLSINLTLFHLNVKKMCENGWRLHCSVLLERRISKCILAIGQSKTEHYISIKLEQYQSIFFYGKTEPQPHRSNQRVLLSWAPRNMVK